VTATDTAPPTGPTRDAFTRSREEVAEKVRKLLTQAEDPAATPEEAQAFTMKAQQLMTKYAIDLAMVTDTNRAGQVVARGWDIPGPYASHKVTLANAVARTNDCRAIYSDRPAGRKHLEVVGYPADVDWVETLSRSLDVQLTAALTQAVRDKPTGVHGRTYAVGFVQGFVAEVADRLQRARRAAVAEADAARRPSGGHAPPADGGRDDPARSVALVLVAKARRVEEEFTVRHPRTRTVHQQVRLRSWSGYGPGRDAGRQASLARGSIGGTPPRLGA